MPPRLLPAVFKADTFIIKGPHCVMTQVMLAVARQELIHGLNSCNFVWPQKLRAGRKNFPFRRNRVEVGNSRSNSVSTGTSVAAQQLHGRL